MTTTDGITRISGMEALTDALIAAGRRAGDRVVLRDEKQALTGSEFADRVEQLPRALAARGMGPGQVVLFGVRPGISALLLLLASMRTGALATFIDPGAGNELFARRLELLKPDWVMAESLLYAASAPTPLRGYLRRRGLELPRLARIPGHHVRVGPKLPLLVPPSESLDELLADRSARDTPLPHGLDDDAPSLVVFTSGTTSAPKGVQHTGRSIAAAVSMMLDQIAMPPDAVLYNHNIHTFVTALLAGVETVAAPLSFSIERFLRDVEQHGATHAFLLPVEAYDIVLHCERLGRRLPETLRRMFLYSAPITPGVLERIHALADPALEITCAYAMTEMIPVTWIDSRAKLAWQGEGDVVGPPCPGVEVRLDDAGQLHLRGDNMQRGYVGAERTEWHATGDIARIDSAGNVVLMGRAKDMIIRGDFNLYPGLYETTVSRIRGVGACAFVGVPDPVTADERVVLVVEPDPRTPRPPETLRRDVARELERGTHGIDRKALPDEVRIVERIPRSGRSSKIDRIALRALVAEDT